MENITVIGAGVAGLAFIEKIREKNNECKITLIDKDQYYLPKNEVISFPGDISNRIELKSWAEGKNVEFINDFVDRINPRRRRIFFKNQEAREFEKLVIASGLTSKKLSLKGEQKEGFFYLSKIDPLKLKDLLKISNEVCVLVSSWLSLKLSFSLADLGKEVRIVAANLDFLGQDKEKIVKLLEEKKITLHLNSFLEEAVGEGMVKAAKISPLMVFSSQLIFVDSGFIPNLSFFEEEVNIQKVFFSDFEEIYFVGDVNHPNIESELFFTNNYKQAKQQADSLADFILNGKEPVFERGDNDQNDNRVGVKKVLKEGELWQSGLA